MAKNNERTNPTLHGLMMAASYSGTVVRGLTFAILVFVVSLVGVAAADGFSGGSAFALWGLTTLAYLAFDVLYVLMAKAHPRMFHRFDGVVLPLALVFSLVVIFLPLVIAGDGVSIGNLWASAAVVLACVLLMRLGILIRVRR